MKVNCAACDAEYNLDPKKVPATGGFFKCRSCGEKVSLPAQNEVNQAAIALAESTPSTPAPEPLAIALDDSSQSLAPLSLSIPLAGSDPLADLDLPEMPPIAGPKPNLASSKPAPPPDPEPIALDDSDDVMSLDDDDAIALDDSDDLAIPLGDTAGHTLNDEAAPSLPANPREEASDLPAAVDLSMPADDDLELPPGPLPSLPQLDTANLPELDDLPAPIGNPAAELPPLGDGESGGVGGFDFATSQGSPIPNDLPPLSLDDLPGPSAQIAGLGALDLADLPSPTASDEPTDLPTPGAHAQVDTAAFDFNAAGDFGASLDIDSTMASDLPTADTGALDLPAPDTEAPSLMDDLASADFNSKASASKDAANEQATSTTPTGNKAPQAAQKAPSSRSLLPLGLLTVLLLGAAAYGAFARGYLKHYLGAEQSSGAPLADDLGQADPRSPTDLTVEPADPEPTPAIAPTRTLSPSNVDSLAWRALKDALATHMAEPAHATGAGYELTLWSQFRLAHTFRDAEARHWLSKNAPKPAQANRGGALLVAATAGAHILEGKLPMAKNVLKRHQKGELRHSPHLLYVTTLTLSRKPEGRKAIRDLEAILKMQPQMVDAKLKLAEWHGLLQNRQESRQIWQSLAESEASLAPFVATIAIEHMLGNQDFDGALSMAELLGAPEGSGFLPAALQATFARAQLALAVLHGKLDRAQRALAAIEPQTPETLLDSARLNGATDETYALLAQARDGLTDDENAELLAHTVRLALGQGHLEQATELLQKAQQKKFSGRNAAGWLKLAEGLLVAANGEVNQAKKAFLAAQRSQATVERAKLELAMVGSEPADWLARLGPLTKRNPLAEVNYYMALAMMARGNHEGAAALLERHIWAAPTLPSPIDLVFTLADALAGAGNVARASDLLAALRESVPRNERVLLTLAERAVAAEEFSTATEWYAELVAQHPTHIAYRLSLAQAHNSAADPMRAQKILDDLLRARPESRSPEILAELGRAWAERDAMKARGYLQEALKDAPDERVFILLGDLERQLSRYDDAEQAYQQAIEAAPKSTVARIRLARLQLLQERVVDAAKVLQDTLRANPKSAEASELLGETLEGLGDARGAAKAYQNAVNLRSPTPSLLLKLARLQLFGQNTLPPAIRTLRQIIDLAPTHAEAHYMLGLAYKDMNRVSDAKNALAAYERLAPDGEFIAEVRQILVDLAR